MHLRTVSVNYKNSKLTYFQVHTGRIFNPGGVLPWKSSIRSYYEKKCPQCPPPGPKVHKDCGEPPVPSCPPIAKPPICPVKRQCDPCKPKKRPCMKMTPCTLKTFPLYNCRFYSGSPCQPKVPSTKPKKPRFCRPKRTVVRPVPKCPSPAYTGRPNVNEVKGKTKVCQPKFGAPGGGVGGGDPCTGAPKAPKKCYQTPGKTARPGQTGKKGPVCPPQSNPCGNPCGK